MWSGEAAGVTVDEGCDRVGSEATDVWRSLVAMAQITIYHNPN